MVVTIRQRENVIQFVNEHRAILEESDVSAELIDQVIEGAVEWTEVSAEEKAFIMSTLDLTADSEDVPEALDIELLAQLLPVVPGRSWLRSTSKPSPEDGALRMNLLFMRRLVLKE